MKASRWTRGRLEEGEDFQLVSNIAMPFFVDSALGENQFRLRSPHEQIRRAETSI